MKRSLEKHKVGSIQIFANREDGARKKVLQWVLEKVKVMSVLEIFT